MKFTLLTIGKTDSAELNTLIDIYSKRLQHYARFESVTIPDLKKTKNLSEEQQKELEGEEILKKIDNSDRMILLDENGPSYSSVGFSKWLQKQMNSGIKNLVFVVGGPYGFSESVYKRANGKLSLSEMTFSHQMVRLFFTEQLYRAFTILRNEPYHHR